MKKIIISKLFLYKNRFIIGYILLGLTFIGLLFTLPLFAQKGLSTAEMESAVSSYNLMPDSIINGDLVDLPYRILQKFSILAFGLTNYSIKLPSILIGLALGFLIILLLNRWFKNNVSLLASILVVLSTPFLFLAGNGTPLIMLVFWPTLLLWLGSKIQGEKKPEAKYCFVFAIILLLSIFTPYMIYFAIFCVFFVFLQPHLRFTVKTLPKTPLIITGIIIVLGIAALGVNVISYPTTLMKLLFAENFQVSNFFPNILTGLSLLFSWNGTSDSVFLSPLISLPIFAIAIIGLFSTTKGFFASRNSIASIMIVFTLVITGFDPNSIIYIVLPLSILVAHGLKYILEKWYGLFPENPYARIFALLPISIFICLIIIPGILQYIYGYRYNPNIANNFSNNLSILNEQTTDETILIESDTLEYNFYKILESKSSHLVIDDTAEISEGATVVTLGKSSFQLPNYQLSRIITSEKSDNSDIIYVYKTVQGE